MEEEGGLSGRPRAGGGASNINAWPRFGFKRSTEIIFAYPLISMVKHLLPPLITQYGPT
jgi:hypothetical protein